MVGAAALVLPVALVALIAATLLGASEQRIVIIFMINLIAVVANGLYSGNSGITSFGHLGFMGIGAYLSAILTMPTALKASVLPNLPGFLAAANMGLSEATIISMLVVGIFAFVIGIPLSRLGGSAASITTLAFLVIVHSVLNGATDFTRGSQTFFGVQRLTTLPTLIVWVAIAIFAARLFRDLPVGLDLRAAREDELAAQAMGVNIPRRRLAAWVVSAMLMAIAGAMIAHFLGAFSPKKFFFVDTFSIIAMLIIGGIGSVSGAVAGTAVVTIVMELARRLEEGPILPSLGLPQVFGLTQLALGAGILIVMYGRPGGLLGYFEIDHWLVRRAKALASRPRSELAKIAAGSLEVVGVSRNFAGLVALDRVSLQLRSGEIVGLIGPNGSGKTTMLNAISGAVPPSSGEVKINGVAVQGMTADKIARQGIGRSFQNIRLFKNLTVLENVEVAVASNPDRGGDIRTEALAALAELGVEHLADRRAGALAYGEQRRVEIARALALRPQYLMLDEPAAGMNSAETQALMHLLREIRDRYGLGLLLVEHHLELVMSLCDRVVVLNKGQVIASGAPPEVQNDPKVIEAYIGLRKHGGSGNSKNAETERRAI